MDSTPPGILVPAAPHSTPPVPIPVPVPAPAPNQEPHSARVIFKDLKVGDIVSCTTYGVVQELSDGGLMRNPRARVKNHMGDVYYVDSGILEGEYYSATQKSRVEKRTATELAQILRSAGGECFLVDFTKKPEIKSVEDKILEILQDEEKRKDLAANKRNLRKFINTEIMTGEKRIMYGRLVHSERSMVTYTEQGRINVIDLAAQFENPKAHCERQVDPRTIHRIILRDVEYQLK
jgi:hypothetical protein